MSFLAGVRAALARESLCLAIEVFEHVGLCMRREQLALGEQRCPVALVVAACVTTAIDGSDQI
jgi:hypothetical protein